jgi:hypothetical protein
VNVASRIRSLYKDIDANFMISRDVSDGITHGEPTESLDQQAIRDRSAKIDLGNTIIHNHFRSYGSVSKHCGSMSWGV